MLESQLTSSQAALVEYLKELDFQSITPIIDGEISMRGKIATDGVIFDTICSLPQNTPPSYPRFYLVDSGLQLREAHVERPQEIALEEGSSNAIVCRTCIREERDKFYSASPVDLFHHLYVDFLGLCSKFARKEFDSKEEIFREFDSYWCNDYTIYWYLQHEPEDGAIIDQIALSYSVQDMHGKTKEVSLGIVTDRPEEVLQFSSYAGWKAQRQKTVYIDLGDTMALPLPSTYGELYSVFEKTGKIDYLKRIKKNITSKIIYLGFDLNAAKKKHYIGVGMKTLGAIRGRMQKAGSLHGDTMAILFSPVHAKLDFSGSNIKSINYDWLMQRGGSVRQMEMAFQKKRIAIVGCGSVGSAIAYKLSKSGIYDFILIDPEVLTASNIGRHQLGMSSVGDYKARAMSRFLMTQFVGLKAQYYCGLAESLDALELIRESDVVITAIGGDAPAVEPWLADLASRGDIPSMIACWLEADGVAGHALCIKNGDSSNFDAICDSLNIIDNAYASSLIESEVGCNSSYMPYGYIDADVHIGKMVHFILSILRDGTSCAITSTGDIAIHTEHLKRAVQPWSHTVYDEAISI